MSLGTAMKLGLGIHFIDALIEFVGLRIYESIYPDKIQAFVDATMLELEKTQGMTDATLDMYDSLYAFQYSFTGGLIMTLISGIFGGAILALIVGAIMKNDPA